MLTPEQIVADWLEMPWINVANDPHLRPLIASIRAYGDERAAAQREQDATIVENWPDFRQFHADDCAGFIRGTTPAPPATPDRQ